MTTGSVREPARSRSSATICPVGRYVERTPDPRDARARLVRIAPRGAAAIPIAAEVVAKIEQEWTAHLGKQRMTQLRRALTQLREITDPWA